MKVMIESEIIMTELDKEIALLNMKNGRYFGLDKTSSRAWEVLCQSKDSEVVFNTLLEEYDVDEDTLKRDMDKMIEELKEAGLIYQV